MYTCYIVYVWVLVYKNAYCVELVAFKDKIIVLKWLTVFDTGIISEIDPVIKLGSYIVLCIFTVMENSTTISVQQSRESLNIKLRGEFVNIIMYQ